MTPPRPIRDNFRRVAAKKKPTIKSRFSRAELEWKLQWTLAQLGQIHVDAGGTLSEQVFKEYLPVQVLETAFATGMIEAPFAIDAVPESEAAEWFDAFLEFLPIDSLYKEWVESPKWIMPTPAVILSDFLVEMRWKLTRVVIEMLPEHQRDDKLHRRNCAEKKFLERHIQKEPLAPTRLSHHHFMLAEIIHKNSTNYATLDPRLLTWRRA